MHLFLAKMPKRLKRAKLASKVYGKTLLPSGFTGLRDLPFFNTPHIGHKTSPDQVQKDKKSFNNF
jgi:hypothetical protein